MNMDMTTKKIGDILVLKLHGRLNIETQNDFVNEFKHLLESGNKQIVLDCKLLDYVSSAGIQALYFVLDHVAQHQGRLVMCSLSDTVDKVFKMIDLESDIPLYGSVDDAVDALQK